MIANRSRSRIAIAGLALALGLALTVSAAPGAARALGPLRAIADLLDRLDLSEAQRAEIRAVLAAHRPSLEALVARELEARAALREAIHQSVVDEAAVREASAAVAVVDADFAVERARIASEIAAVLTPEQRERLHGAIAEMHAALAERVQSVYRLGLRLL
jgi:Spy/CpxP family protein refolding chaperone